MEIRPTSIDWKGDPKFSEQSVAMDSNDLRRQRVISVVSDPIQNRMVAHDLNLSVVTFYLLLICIYKKKHVQKHC